MYINDLIIEVTRRCNMKCDHCLRGDTQNKSMKDEYMYNLLGQVEYISSVTFTGGEPTLPSGIKTIERFMEICNELNVRVGNFYIVTNAKVWRKEFPELINRLYNFCDDNEISGIHISNDVFHDNDDYDRKSFKYRLEEELLYNYGIEGMADIRQELPNDHNYIISEGRGYYTGSRCNELEIILYEDDEDDFRIIDGIIYLNCNGQIIAGYDWSYESQAENEKIQLCMSNDNLQHAVMAYNNSFK